VSRQRLTFDEIIGFADEATAVVASIRAIVQSAKAASADGVVTDEEIKAIEGKAQEGMDALQKLVSEVVAEATD